MESVGNRADSTSASTGHYRGSRPSGWGEPKQERPNSFRMTEHELLRIITFLERVRQPFQEVIPIAEEDATWNMLLFLMKSHLTGAPVTLSALASVAQVPHATAMRRIHALLESGHIVTETLSDTGKRFRLLPSEELSDSFLQYARRIKFLLA
jgi:multiple sugar transport system substrate-binding protein